MKLERIAKLEEALNRLRALPKASPMLIRNLEIELFKEQNKKE